jgi:hypothetical protein
MTPRAGWALLALAVAMVAAPAWALDADVLAQGRRRLREGDDAAAAALWLGTANATIAEARDAAGQRDGCLLYVLATLALERGSDTQAYASWGRAVQCYAGTGTSWDAERSGVAARRRQADDGLRARAGRDGPRGPVRERSAADAELIAIAGLVPLATYDGPAFRVSPSSPAGDAPRDAPVSPLVGPQAPAPAGQDGAPSPLPPTLPRRGVVPAR